MIKYEIIHCTNSVRNKDIPKDNKKFLFDVTNILNQFSKDGYKLYNIYWDKLDMCIITVGKEDNENEKKIDDIISSNIEPEGLNNFLGLIPDK